MSRFTRFVPVASAFVAGFAVMSLELLGSRLVAPVLGSSILIWTNLIGVILVALACGAWVGGTVSDRSPDWKFVSFLLAGSGLWSLALAFWSRGIMGVLTLLPMAAAAPLIALVLLAPPAFLLGAVPPAVLRLAMKDLARTGRAAGFLSAVGTFGSLLGTYLTGYILLPRYPVHSLLIGIATVLILLGIAIASGAVRKQLFFSALCIGVVIAPAAPGSRTASDGTFYPSAYANVLTRDIMFRGEKAHALYINKGLHAAGEFTDPGTSAIDYVQGIRAVDVAVATPTRMLALGGGGFHVAREFAFRHPDAAIDVLEIDPAVVKAAQDIFGPVDDPHISLTMGDARMSLPRLAGGYDVLISDAYAGDNSVPWHLLTQETFAEYRRVLNPEGVFVANIIMTDESGGRDALKFQKDLVATSKTAFRWVFAVSVERGYSEGQPINVLLFAGNGSEPDHAAILAAVKRETGSMWPREIRLAEGGTVWTDDFGPADYESLAMYVEAGR
jgi:predicted membrane-bound spermidine synthase